jgi:hypothetical protein
MEPNRRPRSFCGALNLRPYISLRFFATSTGSTLFDRNGAIAILILLVSVFSGRAEVEVLPEDEPQLCFSGQQKLKVTFRNTAEKPFEAPVRMRLFQASSATVVPVRDMEDWKPLHLLPRQTILEEVSVEFPEVRQATIFRIEWQNAGGSKLGRTTVRVFPPTLLEQITTIAEKTPIGVFEPDNLLKPLLKKTNVEFQDLENGGGFDDFHGNLVIIGPFASKESLPENFRDRVLNAARKFRNCGFVFVLPKDVNSDPLLPIFIANEGESALVVVRADAVHNLAESPRSQLTLIRAAQIARTPESLRFPQFEK